MEKMSDVLIFLPAPKVDWKCGMARMDVMREPSYPFAMQQQNATKMATGDEADSVPGESIEKRTYSRA